MSEGNLFHRETKWSRNLPKTLRQRLPNLVPVVLQRGVVLPTSFTETRRSACGIAKPLKSKVKGRGLPAAAVLTPSKIAKSQPETSEKCGKSRRFSGCQRCRHAKNAQTQLHRRRSAQMKEGAAGSHDRRRRWVLAPLLTVAGGRQVRLAPSEP